MNNLTKSIEYLSNKKSIDFLKAEPHRFGVTNFGEVIKLLARKLLENKTNRFEDLVTKKDYRNKLEHMIRFVSGISSKGAILITIMTDNSKKCGFIRDAGTMVSLLSKYWDVKYLNGNEWLKMIDLIKTEYEPDVSRRFFLEEITDYFSGMSEQRKRSLYSLKDVVTNDEVINNQFDSCHISYEINCYSSHLHSKDMVNANRLVKPWNPFDFYDTPLKSSLFDKYHDEFCGEDLLIYFKDKPGANYFSKDKFMSGWGKKVKDRIAYRLVPIYISYMISEYVDIDDLDEACKMITKWSSSDNPIVWKYWSSKWEQMIRETTRSDIENFYTKYLEVYNSSHWDKVIDVYKELKVKNSGKEGAAFEGLSIKKDDTSLFFMSLVLLFKKKYPKQGISTLVKYVTNTYVKLLTEDVIYYNEDIKENVNLSIVEYFGEQSGKYQSASVNSRVDKLFTYIPTEVKSKIEGKKTDRKGQSDYREKSMGIHLNACRGTGVRNKYNLYPLSSDTEISTIDFNSKDNLRWIHPNDKDNKAVNGFLGFEEDNSHKDWKNLNWPEYGVKSQKDYWEKVLEHNMTISDTITNKLQKRKLDANIDGLSAILDCSLKI